MQDRAPVALIRWGPCSSRGVRSLTGYITPERPLRDNAVVLDPEEGLNPDGTIRTGVRRDRVPVEFEPVVRAAAEALLELSDEGVELHLYGSVATGMAQVGTSDVDMVAIGVSGQWARDLGAALSTRFANICRGVEIGQGRPADFSGDDDAAYGNRVFLRHYCVSLAGPDTLRSVEPFQGDVRAARGFNGDIGRCLVNWRAGADPRRVARKTLLAAAGVVSAHDRTWTTDRGRAARRWVELDPERSDDMVRLLAWAEGNLVPSAAELDAALAQDGVVGVVVDRFAAEIGLWPDRVDSATQ